MRNDFCEVKPGELSLRRKDFLDDKRAGESSPKVVDFRGTGGDISSPKLMDLLLDFCELRLGVDDSAGESSPFVVAFESALLRTGVLSLTLKDLDRFSGDGSELDIEI